MPVAVINSRRVLFIHIPKTGGTSLTRWMQSHGRVRLHADQRPNGLFVSPQHLTYADVDTMWGCDYFDYLFTIVRNPFHRMESEFKMRNKLRGKGFFGGQLNFSSWLERSIMDARANLNHMDNHLRPQWQFVSDRLRIFRFEDGMDNILAQLSADLGIAPPALVPHELATADDAYAFPWDRADILRMRDFYALDFETFDYDVEPNPRKPSRTIGAKPQEATTSISTAAPAQPAEVARDIGIDREALTKLSRKYISLGDNCEFGFVQRIAGNEDGGLLRFAIAFPEVLLHNLHNGFDGLYRFENLTPHSPKMVADAYSGIKFHSNMLSKDGAFVLSADERRPIHAVEFDKIAYLRNKLEAALSDAGSVFVYKHNSGISEETGCAIAAALRERGGARILIVRDGDAPAVRQIENNLFYGWIPMLAKYADAAQPDLKSWAALLKLADPVIFGA